MADPFTLVTAGSAVLGAVGSLSKGGAQSAQYQGLAQDQQYQATVARQNASEAITYAGSQEDAQRTQARYQIGEQAAAGAQSGVIASQGSLGQVERQSAVNKELQALNIRFGGQVNATNSLNQAAIDTQSAQRDQSNAGYAQQSGYLSALGSVFGGVGSYLGGRARANPNSPTNTAGWFGGP